MRANKYGKNVSLRDEVVDIITNGVPINDENDSFISSKNMDIMIDNILEAVEEHINYNLDSRRIVE